MEIRQIARFKKIHKNRIKPPKSQKKLRKLERKESMKS